MPLALHGLSTPCRTEKRNDIHNELGENNMKTGIASSETTATATKTRTSIPRDPTAIGANFKREHADALKAQAQEHLKHAVPASNEIRALKADGQDWLTKGKSHDKALFKLLQDCFVTYEQMTMSSEGVMKAYADQFERHYKASFSKDFDEKKVLSEILLFTFNKGSKADNKAFRSRRSKYHAVLTYVDALIEEGKLDSLAIATWIEGKGLDERYAEYTNLKNKGSKSASSGINPLDTRAPLADVVDSNGELAKILCGEKYELAVLRVNGDGNVQVIKVFEQDSTLRKKGLA